VSAGILICVETFDGMTKWRSVPDLEHGTLCRAFGLDPCSCWFELPSSARGTGSASVGASSGVTMGRDVNGYIFRGPRGSDPIGKIMIERQGRRIRDDDPTDPRDFFRL